MSDPNHIDYLVIKTRYTSRILGKDLPNIWSDFTCDEHDVKTNHEVLQKLQCLFVKDELWGPMTRTGNYKAISNGFYAVSPNQAEVEEAISTVLMEPDDGIIVFKAKDFNTAFRAIMFLQNVDYCACFELRTLCDFKIHSVNGKKVLKVEFDTESG